jgi:hypothetical protein
MLERVWNQSILKPWFYSTIFLNVMTSLQYFLHHSEQYLFRDKVPKIIVFSIHVLEPSNSQKL